jgi:lipid-binding SYLF domain-containing protein
MRSLMAVVALVVVGTVAVGAKVSSKETDRIHASADVLAEIHGQPDKGIPQDLWQKAACVVVIPSLKKAAFGFGAEYGKGLMSCRRNSAWGAPVFMELEKGSWGFQVGGESVDLVLLVMNESGMKKMLQDKVSLGADASVAAGPVGRNAGASTNALRHCENRCNAANNPRRVMNGQDFSVNRTSVSARSCRSRSRHVAMICSNWLPEIGMPGTTARMRRASSSKFQMNSRPVACFV